MENESTVERVLALAISDVLKDRRGDTTFTQAEVAAAAGMAKNPYQNLESGLSNRSARSPANPGIQTLFRISQALHMPFKDLLVQIADRYDYHEARRLDGHRRPGPEGLSEPTSRPV
ncbi:hypothetical protein [Brevibacterium litoralis]|uniref:hypothetical protein n=1 Tax=Brevibacterium litoralis TaxID=3138935 RepID=UPI0032EB4BC5